MITEWRRQPHVWYVENHHANLVISVKVSYAFLQQDVDTTFFVLSQKYVMTSWEMSSVLCHRRLFCGFLVMGFFGLGLWIGGFGLWVYSCEKPEPTTHNHLTVYDLAVLVGIFWDERLVILLHASQRHAHIGESAVMEEGLHGDLLREV